MKTVPPVVPALELRRRENVRQGILRIAAAYVAVGKEQLARPRAEQPAAIHATRLVLKRLRALFRLLAPSLPDSLVQRQRARLRQSAVALAPAREAGVALQTLAALAAQAPARDLPAVTRVRDALAAVPGPARHSPARLQTALERAVRTAESAARALGRARWHHHGWKVLSSGFHPCYRKARRRLKSAHAASDAKSFHAWRTATKSLFYQVHLVQAAAPLRLRALAKNLDRIQDQLGLEHDLAILDQLLVRHRRKLGEPAALARVRELIASRQSRHRKLALKDGRRVFALRACPFVERLHADWKRWRR